jgi:hypothetical protein
MAGLHSIGLADLLYRRLCLRNILGDRSAFFSQYAWNNHQSDRNDMRRAQPLRAKAKKNANPVQRLA